MLILEIKSEGKISFAGQFAVSEEAVSLSFESKRIKVAESFINFISSPFYYTDTKKGH